MGYLKGKTPRDKYHKDIRGKKSRYFFGCLRKINGSIGFRLTVNVCIVFTVKYENAYVFTYNM
ncbi:hypothetical protein DSECCO2_655970 [anaerobic digester metagenome]|jgi:hypothetical protein